MHFYESAIFQSLSTRICSIGIEICTRNSLKIREREKKRELTNSKYAFPETYCKVNRSSSTFIAFSFTFNTDFEQRIRPKKKMARIRIGANPVICSATRFPQDLARFNPPVGQINPRFPLSLTFWISSRRATLNLRPFSFLPSSLSSSIRLDAKKLRKSITTTRTTIIIIITGWITSEKF